LFGIWTSRHAADKVQEVYNDETKNRNGINEMKAAMKSLKDKMNNSSDLPADFTNRIDEIEQNLRFLSPANNGEAYELEESFVTVCGTIYNAIFNYSMNEEQIEQNLKKLERIYQNRKKIYSN